MRFTSALFHLFAFFAVTFAACGVNESTCGFGCYNPSQGVYTCATDNKGTQTLCPTSAPAACNGGCYNPSQYSCYSYGLGPKATGAAVPTSSTLNVAKTTSTTPATTSSTAAKTTSSSTAAKTTSSMTPSTSAAAQSTFSLCTANCGSGLSCCGAQCYSSSSYSCPLDSVTFKPVLCALGFQSCNLACYNPNQYACKNGGLAPATATAAAPTSATPVKSSTTGAASTTGSPVNVNPTPAPGNFPKQTSDLRIINSCKTTLWFEARYGGQGAPIPGQSATATMALPGSYVDYTVPDSGLSGTRFWAKYGCDASGKNCAIGDQMQYWPNPPGGCPAGGCTPPVDSLFEATWGCRPGSSCNAQNPTTWFDTSQVDGWTIPYKLTPNGDTSGCDCIGTQCGFKGVDASTLDLKRCPSNENLVAGGQSSVNVLGKQVSLNSVDLRIISNNTVLGCMSPCKRLNWGVPHGLGQEESSGSTMWMCCPTPTPASCSPANGCITPDVCRSGPIEKTQFVAAVHAMAPGVYSYSYDDGVGLHACPAGVTTYTMEFCPTGSSQYPLQL